MKKENHSNASAKQMGWDAEDGQSKRRRAILDSCHGNALKAARILQNTAIRGGGEDVRRKARNDAQYFFKMHERRKERVGRNAGKR